MDTPNTEPTAEAEETYDAWFRRKVQEAIDIADGPDAEWIPHEEVERDWAAQRAEILSLKQPKRAK
ncbi:hypothetical protein [Rhizobium sp. TRM95796]|uniref:hypothetical protein n=1 Tax=Rhizobium sp. TRM95796 TaxID=2979862 RepID=UPI0021E8893E|nr:hypothetical protein [Rhizobium sp. TRM95796]MCV3768575.1 hypothetical protein [Rhizobium sp. TRM95796]